VVCKRSGIGTRKELPQAWDKFALKGC
jgi:hypothetical protein